MTARIIRTLMLSFALVFIAAPLAYAGKGEGGPIAKIIKHAKELSLTSDQISKLEALAKEAHGAKGAKGAHKDLKAKLKDILTPEQIEKIKKYMEEHKKKA